MAESSIWKEWIINTKAKLDMIMNLPREERI
jgi:hypothetical protein